MASPVFKIEINADEVLHTMRGGIGASWHAMSKDIPLENEKYDYPVRFQNPRGSAYGGNPPVSETDSWDQMCRHATWLGLNFNRVELSQRMYEPERGVFDWNNEEMLALYRILDWCEAHEADVFLQQMWGHVEWNAFPGVHPLLSAPRSLDDFASGIRELLSHLLHEKQYTCIKYFSITNEPPGGTWGYWWSYGQGSGTITNALRTVREYLDAAGIRLPLSGPDWTSLPPLDPKQIDFDRFIGAYDIHSLQRNRSRKRRNRERLGGMGTLTAEAIFPVRVWEHEDGVGRRQCRAEELRGSTVERIGHHFVSEPGS